MPELNRDPGVGQRPLAVAIVAEHASARFGGEAALPLHYFRVLRGRGWPVWLVCHARVREELVALFPGDADRMRFVEDSVLHRAMWRLGRWLPARLSYISTGYVSRLATQLAQRRLVRELVREQGVEVVHQPMPVSPREPSLLHGLGVPVVIGPMNGGMTYPPAFRQAEGRLVRGISAIGRSVSGLLNRCIPGKRRAALLLVANERTRRALPPALPVRTETLVENGVDLALWQPVEASQRDDAAMRLLFMGRLVDWKAVDLLLEAFARASLRAPLTLEVYGDGPEGARLRQLAADRGVLAERTGQAGQVHFAGWQTQQACAQRLRAVDVLVLPSLWECGGAVVLEAMACARPVIATAWGGPLDYLDDRCGILVPPDGREALVQGLADAMVELARDPARRRALGAAGRHRVETLFDWERKVDRVQCLYHEVLAAQAQPAATESP